MKLISEDQLLDANFRKVVIKEILGPENITRKKEHLRRYEIYKDQTKRYVMESLEKEGLKPGTIEMMRNRAANISICRKIVNKLARTYSGGVSRETSMDVVDQQVAEMASLLCFDEKMKKGDRYRELHKNMMFQVVPEYTEEGSYKLALRTLLPWHYDVIEDSVDREIARCVILSDFSCHSSLAYAAQGEEKRHSGRVITNSDGVDQIIADNPADAKTGVFVWWSKNYHFITDSDGELVSMQPNENLENPIHELPFANNAEDQDGQFWALGGDDLVDGSVLINKKITDMNFIAYHQGFGQWVFSGKNLEEKIAMGPNNAIVLNYDPSVDEPKPDVQVLSANPPLESWLRIIEQYVALLLTTNNLSTSNVSMKLEGANAASGIMLMIEQSESTDDISDKQKNYQDIEKKLWHVIALWQNLYLATNELEMDFAEVGRLPDDLDVKVRFNDIKPVITESEKLNTYKLRKELGLDSQLDLIMKDNPHFTLEDAQKKLMEITQEKLNNVSIFQQNSQQDVNQNDNQGQQNIL